MSNVTLQAKVGAAMRERRSALGYSQDSFADAIDMHRAYYSAIERGERNITLATLQRVANGLDWQFAADGGCRRLTARAAQGQGAALRGRVAA